MAGSALGAVRVGRHKLVEDSGWHLLATIGVDYSWKGKMVKQLARSASNVEAAADRFDAL